MKKQVRSGCPINLAVEAICDPWSLIVIRDIMFGNRRHFRDLLRHSEEGIASNILVDRLKRLVEAGLLTQQGDPTHRQKMLYSLTEAAIQLVPVLVHLGAWGRAHRPASPDLSVRAACLEQGGPELWSLFMDELRAIHLGAPAPGRSVLRELDAAYRQSVASGRGQA